jgi:hypothetical protein
MAGAVQLALPLPALDRSVDRAVTMHLEQHELDKPASEYTRQNIFYETVICMTLQS